MIVIGLSGKAKSGKGSVVQLAQILLQHGDDEMEVRQVSFATEVKRIAKEVVNSLQRMYGRQDEAYTMLVNKYGLPGDIAVEVIDLARGLTEDDIKKKTPRARKLLQFIGTEAFRRNVDDLYWVKRAAEKIAALPSETSIAFIPDCRFINEADYVRNVLGGEIWRVNRFTIDNLPYDNELTPEQKVHPSETELDDYKFDVTIYARNMEELFNQVKEQIERLQKEGKI